MSEDFFVVLVVGAVCGMSEDFVVVTVTVKLMKSIWAHRQLPKD